MQEKSYSWKLFGIEFGLIIAALLVIAPFYFVFANSVKGVGEIYKNAASFPGVFNWTNYERAWKYLDFMLIFKNTLFITVFTDIGTVIICSMAAYYLVRRNTIMNRILSVCFMAAMLIPFQALMIPLIKVSQWFLLINSIPGVIICYLGIGLSFSTFLYISFIKTVPYEIEESAMVDGCTPYGVFWKIVFPLLVPMTVTVVLLKSLWVWNEFLLTSIILQKKELRTIQLAINTLFGEHTNQWDIALPALVMSMIPLLIFFLVSQRRIVEGIAVGAVKG